LFELIILFTQLNSLIINNLLTNIQQIICKIINKYLIGTMLPKHLTNIGNYY